MKGGLYNAVSEDWLGQLMNLRVTDSTLNEGTNSLVTSKSGWERWFIMCCHTMSLIKNLQWLVLRNGGTFSSIIDILILYSKNILGL